MCIHHGAAQACIAGMHGCQAAKASWCTWCAPDGTPAHQGHRWMQGAMVDMYCCGVQQSPSAGRHSLCKQCMDALHDMLHSTYLPHSSKPYICTHVSASHDRMAAACPVWPSPPGLLPPPTHQPHSIEGPSQPPHHAIPTRGAAHADPGAGGQQGPPTRQPAPGGHAHRHT